MSDTEGMIPIPHSLLNMILLELQESAIQNHENERWASQISYLVKDFSPLRSTQVGQKPFEERAFSFFKQLNSELSEHKRDFSNRAQEARIILNRLRKILREDSNFLFD